MKNIIDPNIKYCGKHDARYDEKEDKWLESKCGEDTCEFCKDRPEKPSQVKE